MINIISSSTYTKVIVLHIDDFETTIVDEHNFGINDSIAIDDFKEQYNPKEFLCVTVNVA